MAGEAGYCPFCGARLHDEDRPLFAHLRENEECEAAFRDWDYDASVPSGANRGPVRSAVMWIIIAVVLGYSLVIAQQVLLGVLASSFVFVAFRWEEIAARVSQ